MRVAWREKAMLRITRIFTALLIISISGRAAPAQTLKVDPNQRYLILEVAKVGTLEKELNAAAQQGFRLSRTASTGARVEALMERTGPTTSGFQYRVVSTVSKKTGEKEMNDAALQGFRIVPHTSLLKAGFTIFDTNGVVVMEKDSQNPATYEYKTVGARSTSDFDKELNTAIADGWAVIDLRYGAVVLERVRK
jgi:hypothetical protein